MRPYIAVIKDSFREAMSSWVLWIVLALITLFLLALAPLGYRLSLTGKFGFGDIVDGPGLAADILDQGEKRDSPGGRILAELDEQQQRRLRNFEKQAGEPNGEYFTGLRQLIDGLNRLVENDEFYQPPAWQDVRLAKETTELLSREDSLSDAEVKRLNRLLIEDAFPGRIRPRSRESVLFTYMTFEMTDPLPIRKEQVDTVIQELVLPGLIGLLLGIFAILAAILVTSPIIPRMFEPGSISLLLSKPVSRTLLFLSKFLGGCAFISLNVTYLLVGLWLIAGARFGIWNQGLLLCIPVFLFLFLIYYSVSALAGLIWKSAVVSVIAVVLFWGLCWVVGTTKGAIEAVFFAPNRLIHLVDAGGTTVAVSENGNVLQWNDIEEQWLPIFDTGPQRGPQFVIGPVYDEKNERMIAAFGGRNPFGGMMGRRSNLVFGDRKTGWKPKPGPVLPPGTFDLSLDSKGRILALSDNGIYRMSSDALTKSSEGLLDMLFGSGGPFKDVGPDDVVIQQPAAAAVNSKDGRVAVYSRGTLWLLKQGEKDQYVVQAERELSGDEEQGAALAFCGNRILLARANDGVTLVDDQEMATQTEAQPERLSQPRFVDASPDGKWFSILYQNRKLWLVDVDQNSIRAANVSGQGDISAARFQDSDRLAVVDRTQRVTTYRIATSEQLTRFGPRDSRLTSVYRYGIVPIYTIFPKPGELDQTIQYLLTNRETTDFGFGEGDLAARQEQIDPWRPVWSSLIFTVVMLIIACVHIERQEF